MANIGVYDSEMYMNYHSGTDGDNAFVTVHGKKDTCYAKYVWQDGGWHYRCMLSKLPKEDEAHTETISTGTVKLEPKPISDEPFEDEGLEQCRKVGRVIKSMIDEREKKLAVEIVRRFVVVMYCNHPRYCIVPDGAEIKLGQKLTVSDDASVAFCTVVSKPFESDLLTLEAAGNTAGMYGSPIVATGIVHIMTFGGGSNG